MAKNKYLKKDGTYAKPKKDGSPRQVGGGYYAEKQEVWGKEVLADAFAQAQKMFGHDATAILARYAEDCGYEGVKRLFIKKYKYDMFMFFMLKFRTLSKKYKNLRHLYADFKELMFARNMERIENERKKEKDN